MREQMKIMNERLLHIQEGVWGNLTDACLKKHCLKAIRFCKHGKQLTFEFYNEQTVRSFNLWLTFSWRGYNKNGGLEIQDSKTHRVEVNPYNPQNQWSTTINLNLMPNSSETHIIKIAKIEITMGLRTSEVRYVDRLAIAFTGRDLKEFKFCFEKDKSVSSEIKQNQQDENHIGTNLSPIKAALLKDDAFKQDINKALVDRSEGLKNDRGKDCDLEKQITDFKKKKEKEELGKLLNTWVEKSKERMTQSELDIAKLKESIPEKPPARAFNIYHEGMQRLLGMGKSDSLQQEVEKIKKRQENGKTAVDLLEKLLEQIPEKDQNLRHREKIELIKSEIAAFLLALCSPKKACAKLVENLLKAGENPGPVPEIEEDHPDVRHLIEAYEYEISLTGKTYWKEYEDYKALLREIGESKGFFDEVFLRFVKNRLFDFNVHALAAAKKEMEKSDSRQDNERETLFKTLETVLMSFGGIEKIRWEKQNVGPQGNEFFEVHGHRDDSDEFVPSDTILWCPVDGYRLNWADQKVLQRAEVMTKRGIN